MPYNSSVTRPTIAVLYGTGEGKRIGKKLCRLLEEHGFVCTDNAAQADAIIAHSGGALLIPPSTAARAILIVGPITGFRGSFLGTALRKVHQDMRGAVRAKTLPAFLGKSLYNAGYIIGKPGHHFRMLRGLSYGRKSLPRLDVPRVAVIAFRDDPWSGFLAENAPHDRHSYAFIHYDKSHDDLWQSPEGYVTVLEYLYAK